MQNVEIYLFVNCDFHDGCIFLIAVVVAISYVNLSFLLLSDVVGIFKKKILLSIKNALQMDLRTQELFLTFSLILQKKDTMTVPILEFSSEPNIHITMIRQQHF